MLNDPRAAALACLCQYSFDMGLSPVNPAADPRLLADGYMLKGHIVGMDEVLGHDSLVAYGFLAQHADASYVLVTRGTYDNREWYEDILGKPTGYALGGQVHTGFWGVFNRFSYLKLGGAARTPLVQGIARDVGQAPLVVVGHSLGGATAIYAGVDLAAELGAEQVSMALFASPRPGDPDFAAVVEKYCPNYISYSSLDDIVPHLPDLGIQYANLLRNEWFSNAERQAVIAPGRANAHHVCGYAASLCYRLKNWKEWGGIKDAGLVSIILGPAPGI